MSGVGVSMHSLGDLGSAGISTSFRIRVCEAALGTAAPVVRNALRAFPEDDFTNPEYYPPKEADAESVLRYFIFMVAVDHRTSRMRPFEARVGSRLYHGADLLYRLGSKKFSEDPEFFSPQRMARVSVDDVLDWLSVKGGDEVVGLWDPEVRADLLADLGSGLVRWFGGSVSGMVKASGGYLRRGCGHGLIYIMRRFKAYSDPVEKKVHLFVKFVERRGLLGIVDPWNKEVPVDNHLTRIALRLGLVLPEESMLVKIRSRAPFTWSEDVALRLAVRTAYKNLSRVAGVDPLRLDDFLWYFGRKVCTREAPACLMNATCPLADVCPSRGVQEALTEHYYLDTYYY
ncbi:MAG: hypothetical protein QW705_07360 [Zestosphaera sp.]